MAEESSKPSGNQYILTDAPTWIIDPLDGTMNFVHSLPWIAISVALFINKTPMIGIIYNPSSGDFFSAIRGQGAYLNGKRIRASGQQGMKFHPNFETFFLNFRKFSDLSKALIAIDLMTFKILPKREAVLLGNLHKLLGNIHGFRIIGSAALSMAYVAQGGIDGYYEHGLQPWNVAAGQLLIEEAGGCVIDTDGKPFNVLRRRLICAG
jgi:myo-inositol-1(or 4)-monophosphatase